MNTAISSLSLQDSPYSLAEAVQWLDSRLGSTFVDGGVNPSFGARNFTLPLQNGQCIGVVCPLDYPTTEQSLGANLLARRQKKAEAGLTLVFATYDVSKAERRYGRSAIEGHRTRQDGSNLKWKQFGVNKVTNARELPFFIQRLIADHPSQDGKAVAAIAKIMIADTNYLPNSCFKTKIIGQSNDVDVEFIEPSADCGGCGVVAVYLMTPPGSIVLS